MRVGNVADPDPIVALEAATAAAWLVGPAGVGAGGAGPVDWLAVIQIANALGRWKQAVWERYRGFRVS